MNNLTTPDDIYHALLIKHSRNAVSKYAAVSRYSRPYISLHIHGHRKNPKVLQEMANHLGCGV